MSTRETAPRPLRKDAERNRRRVLEAAREVFAEHGLAASLDDIARHAGVGVGTVYRRFPDKEQLIDALFEERVGEMVELARASQTVEDPWAGLEQFLTAAQELQATDRGLKEVLLGDVHERARVTAARDRIAPLVQQLLDRAQQAGAVRRDVSFTDLPLSQFAIGGLADYTRDIAPDAWRRMLVLVLDGLRATGTDATPMPAAPVDQEDLERVMQAAGHADRRRRG